MIGVSSTSYQSYVVTGQISVAVRIIVTRLIVKEQTGYSVVAECTVIVDTSFQIPVLSASAAFRVSERSIAAAGYIDK